MPLVLQTVVRPPREEARDGGPLVPVDSVSGEQALFLFFREGTSIDCGIELVEPSQSTALSCAVVECVFVRQDRWMDGWMDRYIEILIERNKEKKGTEIRELDIDI